MHHHLRPHENRMALRFRKWKSISRTLKESLKKTIHSNSRPQNGQYNNVRKINRYKGYSINLRRSFHDMIPPSSTHRTTYLVRGSLDTFADPFWPVFPVFDATGFCLTFASLWRASRPCPSCPPVSLRFSSSLGTAVPSRELLFLFLPPGRRVINLLRRRLSKRSRSGKGILVSKQQVKPRKHRHDTAFSTNVLQLC